MTRPIRGFLAAPFVASTIYPVIWKYHLVNGPRGHIGLLNDLWVIIFVTGFGLPFAVAATVLLAVPAYLVIRRTIGVSLATAAGSGVAIGLCVSGCFAALTHDWSAVPPIAATVIGVLTALVWWRIARPSAFVQMSE